MGPRAFVARAAPCCTWGVVGSVADGCASPRVSSMRRPSRPASAGQPLISWYRAPYRCPPTAALRVRHSLAASHHSCKRESVPLDSSQAAAQQCSGNSSHHSSKAESMDAPLSAGRGPKDPSERKPRGGGGGGPRGGARSGAGKGPGGKALRLGAKGQPDGTPEFGARLSLLGGLLC